MDYKETRKISKPYVLTTNNLKDVVSEIKKFDPDLETQFEIDLEGSIETSLILKQIDEIKFESDRRNQKISKIFLDSDIALRDREYGHISVNYSRSGININASGYEKDKLYTLCDKLQAIAADYKSNLVLSSNIKFLTLCLIFYVILLFYNDVNTSAYKDDTMITFFVGFAVISMIPFLFTSLLIGVFDTIFPNNIILIGKNKDVHENKIRCFKYTFFILTFVGTLLGLISYFDR